MLKRTAFILTCTAASALVAVPLLAQQAERPSRECIREIVQLCGRDRSQMRACLQEKASELSEGCAAEVRERATSRRGNRSGNTEQAAPAIRPDRTVFYGDHQRQQIEVFAPDGAVDELPLVLHIHGGGWTAGDHKRVQSKPAYFTGQNYYFASTGYRLMPGAPVEEQARDIGAAIRALRGQASSIGFDPDRIVLMGHSAGAHLAALVSTDPQYAGAAFSAIRGVILLDGAGYDIADSIANAERQAAGIYSSVFGDDPARHMALSSVTHVGSPDAPNWLALYVRERAQSKKQSEALVSGLSNAGADARAVAIDNTDHGRMNREIGTEAGSQQTAAIGTFLAEILP
ncbi:hypothetical protein MTsPCn3_18890 [Erythrobacter sp. MTPC3]